ncbi:2-oxo-4-hydroxy-4-carboxy-5-ureidoimidazoline decarboxylase [Phytohabitans rumicis]|uniref:2-oxo-4-hydroxy-4-carboxy-5-ureidoimidazoline decarboxylase n=1 Tax=Phytohabitans rumicis TaxID=1076125 RepID=A0A6V8L6D9_9ACTN|nr:2-oxo-4-hydroxy-4-carboxy-5-ureidoimidazoline decarboxylase [Phytohabitans rumicis]GFJ92793.1 OHCU decarboxylase [Phytohabitans rumicis]
MTGSLAEFNALPPAEAERELLACCAAPAWARAVAAGRPYPDRMALRAAGDVAAQGLAWADVALALSAHPRIGERVAGGGREAAWSRREQAGAADSPVAVALAQVNREYEERFGHVFLIFATGKSPEEMLAAARARLAHDEAAERPVVREELRKIALLRLERLVG